MKRTFAVILTAVIFLTSVLLTGCGAEVIEAGESARLELDSYPEKYPVYHSYDESGKRIYALIYEALAEGDWDTIRIGVYETEEELERDKDWLNENLRQILFEQPDYFWIDPYNYTVKTTSDINSHTLILSLPELVEESEIGEMKAAYNRRIDLIVEEASQIPQLFDRVLYVYDRILSIAEYDESLLTSQDSTPGLSAYGCLVEGKTVCSGYTMAFTSIMQKLGIECSSEFNTYENFSVIDGHVWNYCKLDGEYYYFDLTWDDTQFDSEEYKDRIKYSHCYFGVSAEELALSNFTMREDAPTPDCNGTEYNYFVYTGKNVSEYDTGIVKQMILSQAENDYIALRFDSYSELLKAKTELMENGGIYDILTDADGVSYVISNTGLHLYIFPR